MNNNETVKDDKGFAIQWFPGHMTKTRRMMEASMKMVDIVIELVDARIPAASRNPEIDKIIGDKPRVILLNKCDEADERVTRKWVEYYKNNGIHAMAADCRSGKGLKSFMPLVKEALSDVLERREKKGMAGRPIRMMVVGIPNVGKSSFINRMAGSKRTKVEDRPGVTRGKQWVSLDNGAELLDMPGVLWPKFEDRLVGERLAFTGAIKDNVMDIETLAVYLLNELKKEYASLLMKRYDLSEIEVQDSDGFDILKLIGKKRGMLISGGEINTERAAIIIIDEFRSGRIGKISLEAPM